MAQHDQNVANGSGASLRGDLNDALAALFSLSSGATAPSTTVAYQWWADTANGLLKQRNAANSGWVNHGSIASALLRLEDVAAGGSGGLLRSDGDGSGLTGISAVDQLARDLGMVGVIESNVGAGERGPAVNYDFSEDTLSVSNNSLHKPSDAVYASAPSFTEQFSLSGDFNENDRSNQTIRQVIPASAIVDGGGSVRITLFGATGEGFSVDSCYIGEQAASGDPYDFEASPTQVTFDGGSSSATIATAGTKESDAISFSVDPSKSYVVSYHITSSAVASLRAKSSESGFASYSKSGDDAATVNASGYASLASNVVGILKLEVGTAFLDMTLQSSPVTLNQASPSDIQVYVIVLEGEGSDAASNVLCAVAIDGSTFTTAEVAAKVYSFDGSKLLRFDIATIGVGGSFAFKVTTQGAEKFEVSAPSAVPNYT